MKRQTLATLMGIGWAACGAGVLTQERPSDPPPSASREVTLKGSEVEYITSEPGPEKTYPGVIRFRVVVEAAATRRVEGAEKDRPGGPQE